MSAKIVVILTSNFFRVEGECIKFYDFIFEKMADLVFFENILSNDVEVASHLENMDLVFQCPLFLCGKSQLLNYFLISESLILNSQRFPHLTLILDSQLFT